MASNEFMDVSRCVLLFCLVFASILVAESSDNQDESAEVVSSDTPHTAADEVDSLVVKQNKDDSLDTGAEGTGVGAGLGSDDLKNSNESETSFFSLAGLLKTVLEEFRTVINDEEVATSDLKVEDEAKVITEPELQLEVHVPDLENTTTTTNHSQENQTSTTDGENKPKKLKFQCYGKNVTENDTAAVKLVNSTELLQILSFKANETESMSDCVLVMFFAPWCPFSAQTAPHYNALGRAYPNLDILAVDAVDFSNLNARFGTVSVPNILLFHQSRAVVKFNQTTRSFDTFVQFVKNLTGLEPNKSVTLDEEDYLGPLSSEPTQETDYLLWLAWLFVCVCSTYMVTVSSTGQHIINRINILWQEHQHIE